MEQYSTCVGTNAVRMCSSENCDWLVVTGGSVTVESAELS